MIRFFSRPYVVWALDRWKVLLIVLLFTLLLAGTLFMPPA